MLNRPSTAVNKWAVVGVGTVLALVAILMLSNPAPNGIFAHPHDTDQTHPDVAADTDDHIHIHYAENGTDAVRDFDSTDPEDSGIEWNVRGVDAADFEISTTGMLTFMESPDFENPTDRARAEADLNRDEVMVDPGEAAVEGGNNEYQITVSATEMSDALPAKRTDIALTVIVGNADDTGELTLQWLQPEAGTDIDATLTDPDGDTTDIVRWTWYTSKVGGIPDVTDPSHWTVVGGDNGSYSPVAADEGRYLRVHVAYTDTQGGATKTADAKSENPVRAEVAPNANASPDFGQGADTRTVPESTDVGDPVGAPLTAVDTNNDTLTYELIADAAANDDVEYFNIDMASGQIAVAQELDYDSHQDRGADDDRPDDGEYTVIVRATDPSGSDDNITVTITVDNVNEAPVVTGRAELSVEEGTDDGYTTLPDAPDISDPPGPTNQQNEYVYKDPDYLDSIARWTLEGDDAGAFDHSGRFEPRYLQFKEAPDYENPTDMNRDNVYEVTLVAMDTDPEGTGAGIGKVNVWLIVTNVEEAGKVVFTEGETAYLDEMLVAGVQDPDDHGGDLGEPHQGVHIVNWQWSRADTDAAGTLFKDIVGETTNTYTPQDIDRGFYLRATATYTDPLSGPDNPATEPDERIATTPEDSPSLRTEMATTDNAVRVAPGPKSEPTFSETGTVTREVAENTPPGEKVGAPVAAMAADMDETLAYTLEGSDAQYFNIDGMGQIRVGGEGGTDPELDYDDPNQRKMFHLTVKVEVTGGEANQNAQVDVNIIVTNVNESPKITDADGEVVVPPVEVSYPEIDEDGAPNTEDVATYMGTDPEGATISWDLRGADAALFTIAGGVLKFVNSPDYENPKDVDGEDTVTPNADAGKNTYSVVVRSIASRFAGDAGPAETVDTLVTVTVTDVDEKGEVAISWLQPEANIQITASLTDPDGSDGQNLPVIATEIDAISWEWTVSEVVQVSLDVENPDHWGPAPGNGPETLMYTPDATDASPTPKYLRVTATYTDRHGAGKTERMMSANPVQAAGGGNLNGSPDFHEDKVDRSVAETTALDANVDLPVTASLRTGDASKDTLTYGLRAVTQADLDRIGTDVDLPAGEGTAPADDLAAFDIDRATGQITVAQKLDFESRGDEGNRDGKYVVVATVTDPGDLSDTVVVVITADDRNEDPVLSGRPELTINEIDSSDADAANPDFVGNPDPAAPTVNVYNVVDEDRRAATEEWSLKGEDAGEFQLIGNVGRTLVFRNQPDYENPADANGDNVYKVTVVTFDGDDGRGEFNVCIAVMNINEDGKITLFDEDDDELVQPRALGPITARLTDPDGGVPGVTWQWERSQVNPPTPSDPLTVISDATSATYTPTNVDTSFFLKVTATYMDAKNDATGDTTARMADVTAAHAVLEVLDLKRAPAFPQDATEVEVAENSPSTTYVGEAIVAAVDPDGTTPSYTLEGDDAALFALVNTRQIVVKVDLDHEKKNSYEVELKASDGALDDTIMVTITVTDRNEAPSVPMEASGATVTPSNNAPEFAAAEDGARSVAENTAAGENIGAPVMATDADPGDTLTYTLGGADMASFDIGATTGQLMTKAALDFETKDSYTVEVMAGDGNGGTDTIAVTITVTDVPEGSALDLYDADNSGQIEGPEVIQAVKDYFADTITGLQVIEVVKLYFAGRSN